MKRAAYGFILGIGSSGFSWCYWAEHASLKSSPPFSVWLGSSFDATFPKAFPEKK